MKKIDLDAFFIKEDSIRIKLVESNFDEFHFFVLRNRKNKQEYRIPIKFESKGSELVLPYNKIELIETGLNRYDLFISNQEGRLFRPNFKDSKVDFKSVKATPFYFTHSSNGFKFYITKDNDISLIKGDYITIVKEFYKKNNIRLPIKDILLTKNKLQFTLPKEHVNTELFFSLKNKDTRIPVEELEILDEHNSYKISFDVDLMDLGSCVLEVSFLKDEILYEAKLVNNEEILSSLADNTNIFCYTNAKQEVSLTSNPLLYIKQFGEVGDKEILFIEQYNLNNDEIMLKLQTPLKNKRVYLFLEDITNGYFTRIDDVKLFEDQIILPNIIIKKDIDTIVGNRYRFIMVLHENTSIKDELGDIINPYSYIGFYTKNYISLKSDKYKEPLSLAGDNVLIPYWSVHNELIFQVSSLEQYYKIRYDFVNINYSCNKLSVNGSKMNFNLENFSNSDESKIKFYLKERRTKERVDLDFDIQEENKVEIEFNKFIDSLESKSSRWDLFIELYKSEVIIYGKVGCFSSSVKNKYSRYFSSLNKVTEEKSFEAVPYLTLKNEISLIWNEENKIRNEQLDCNVKVIGSQVKDNLIDIKVKLTDVGVENYTVESGTIMLRNKAIDMKYEIPVETIEKQENNCQLLLLIDPAKYYLIPFYWDIFINIKVADKIYPIRVKNPIKSVKNHIDNNINENEIDLADNFMIYPYITADNSYALCFREREVYENKINRFKEKLAYHVYKTFKGYFDKKDIWLGFEKNASTAQDNGYQFFNYCYKNKKKENFYYIIKKDAIDYKDIKHQRKNILNFMSFKYMLYMYAAKLLISSESKGHGYDIRIQKGKLKDNLDKKKLIFLQHGVIALKKVDYVFKKKKNNPIMLFEVVSDYEKNIIKEYFDYKDSEIMVTGLARWDVLKDKSTQENRKIFMMPTWRSWMDGVIEAEFLNSTYYKKYKEVLESKELNNLLEKNNITLHFMLHPKFLEYSNKFHFGGKNIVTHQFGEVKINEMMMESSLLITDYSSVSWDFYYMKKPTIFYQFDRDEYSKYQGSYLDLETELFGDAPQDINELLSNINYYINNDFKEKDEYAKMRKKYFKYVDRKNSERTFKEIMKIKNKI
ncbi:CDP-glycerol glycerophosphotransferase family protein [Bacillus sp. AFS055030]|uniref:CDP-glycerol glycerophosphotransferase family protein n=1 Tax=Bacillus sp. AFS055030 TaxID=2033507 RepID=UPI0015D4A591|nr:CDP-glycerol glycerophosphotransferase family protein [Bacillus sp. AFS055030]